MQLATTPANGRSLALPVAVSLCRDLHLRRPAARGAAVLRAGRAADNPLTTSVFDALPVTLLQTGLELRPPTTGGLQHGDAATADPLTVYSVRFTTGFARGAALSEPYSSAVNLLIVGQEGKAVLQNVSSVNDPAAATEHMRAICQVVDARAGIDCTLVPALPPTTSPSPPGALTRQPPQPKLRFQEGQVDEISFLAPELGRIVGVLVGTERGTWLLDEVNVSSSRTAHIDRFVCREKLGERLGEGAAWLVPVPPGALVYGSGDSTVILTKEQAANLRASDLAEYDDLKSRVLLTNAALAAGGTGMVGLAAGLDAAVPFAVGGAAGLVYQWLLQLGVDTTLGKLGGSGSRSGTEASGEEVAGVSAGRWSETTRASASAGPAARSAGASQKQGAVKKQQQKQEEQREKEDYELLEELLPPPPGVAGMVRGIAANPAMRLGFVAAVSLVGMSSLHHQGLMTQAVASCAGLQCMMGHASQEGIWKLFLGLLGFLTYKVALVGASMAPSPVATAQVASGTKSKQYERNEKY